MSTPTFSPPFHSPAQVAVQLQEHGYAVLQPLDVAAWLGCDLEELHALTAQWNDLPLDQYLKDGGRYRYRRHASFVVRGGAAGSGRAPPALAAHQVQRLARGDGALV